MNMLDSVIEKLNSDFCLGDRDRDLVAETMKAVLLEMGAIIKASWEDEYPPELKPSNVVGRKLFRKNRVIARTLAVTEFKEFIEACGE